ncbi:MAG: hypothetical protein ACPGXK_12115 [Phycisphaerae bacterium]
MMKNRSIFTMCAAAITFAWSGSAMAQIANDDCATAIPVGEGSPAAAGDNAMASASDDSESGCTVSNQDAWYLYTANCTGIATIDTFGSEQADTVLDVYEDCDRLDVTCNDDTNGLHAQVVVPVTVDRDYVIRVGSVAAAGPFVLNISCSPIVSNDGCGEAISVTDGTPAFEGDNSNTVDADAVEASCAAAGDLHDVWLTYEATCNGVATVDTFGSEQPDTVVSIYDACGGSEIACADDTVDGQALVQFAAEGGASYQIRVASAGRPGDYDVNIACDGVPSNDHCDNAVTVTDGQPAFEGSNAAATTSDGELAPCFGGSSDVWFAYTATCTGRVRAWTDGSEQIDTVLGIYDGCSGSLISCDDDSSTLQADVAADVVEGASYLISLSTIGVPGDFDLNIECTLPPTNDICTSAQSVSAGSPAASGSNSGADVVDDAEAGCSLSDGDVWFVYEAACSVETTIDAIGSDPAAVVLSVFDGCGGNEFACEVPGDDGQTSLTFSAQQGASYWIRLGSIEQPGSYSLNITFEDANENGVPDACDIAAPTLTAAGSRYLGIDAAPGALAYAMRLTSSDLPCVSRYVDIDDDPAAAAQGVGRLVDTPVYRLPEEWGTLIVRGEEIRPDTEYGLNIELEGAGVAAQSVPVRTDLFGDADQSGIVNLGDVQIVVQAFQGGYNGSIGLVDLAPCSPDVAATLEDALWAVLGFRNEPFDIVCASPCAE